MEIKRGDIWMVDFGPPEDDEDHLQHSIRPVVIVSNNRANEHSMVLHAVPLTSKIKKNAICRLMYLSMVFRQKGWTGTA